MKQFSYFLGIDVSKEKIDWVLIDANFQVITKGDTKNNTKSITDFAHKELKARKLKAENVLVCLEQTGCYSLPSCTALYEASFPVWLEDPTRIKSANTMSRVKNDEMDALKIATYAARFYNTDLRIWAPLPDDLLKVRELLAERERLYSCKSLLSLPLKEHRQMENKVGVEIQEAYSTPAIEFLHNLIKEVEKTLETLVNESESFKDSAKIMRSIPGVGPVLTATMIKVTDNFTRFTPKDFKQLACHAGVVPFANTSGSSLRGRPKLSRKANKELKKILHMASLTAMKYIPEFAVYFAAQKAMGKNTMSVLNGIRNKLLRLVMTLLDKGCLYDKSKGKLAISAALSPSE